MIDIPSVVSTIEAGIAQRPLSEQGIEAIKADIRRGASREARAKMEAEWAAPGVGA